MKESKILSVALSIAIAFLVLTAAIAVPILFRPFYYWQIGPLGLEAATGLSRSEIIEAYNQMMNFCIGITHEFSTGVLAWSEWGRSHFVDVRSLFMLDLIVLGVTALGLLAWRVARSRLHIRPYRFAGRTPGFYAGAGLLSVFIVVGLLAATNFSRAFTIFHRLFFPGKENWIFDPAVDQIILILPETFFMNCAILILVLLIGGCLGLMIAGRRRA